MKNPSEKQNAAERLVPLAYVGFHTWERVPATAVTLDGEFTAEQLRVILDALENPM